MTSQHPCLANAMTVGCAGNAAAPKQKTLNSGELWSRAWTNHAAPLSKRRVETDAGALSVVPNIARICRTSEETGEQLKLHPLSVHPKAGRWTWLRALRRRLAALARFCFCCCLPAVGGVGRCPSRLSVAVLQTLSLSWPAQAPGRLARVSGADCPPAARPLLAPFPPTC